MFESSLNLKGPHRHELAELADVAGNLAAGNGGPERYRKPATGMSALPDHGRADLNVICMETPHRPMAALFVASLVLYGLNFEDDLARIGITEISVEVYETLQQEFGRVSRFAMDTSTPSLALPSDIAGGGLTAAAAALAPPTSGRKTMLTMTVAKGSTPSVRSAPSSRVALPPGVGLPSIVGK